MRSLTGISLDHSVYHGLEHALRAAGEDEIADTLAAAYEQGHDVLFTVAERRVILAVLAEPPESLAPLYGVMIKQWTVNGNPRLLSREPAITG
jgi:type II secretory pathway component PulK